ncbi:hypothetical protein MBANPS3_012515 [Mucor bainieri]
MIWKSCKQRITFTNRINHWGNLLTESWFSNKVCTINQHYMMHLPDNIIAMGPMKGYSARVLERTIGLVKSRIKSRFMPRENSASVLKSIHAENVDKRDRFSSQAAENSSNSANIRLASISEFDGKCDLAAMLQHHFGDTFDMEDGAVTIVESK